MNTSFQKEREQMVEKQIYARGVIDPLILEGMKKVPRHLFVSPDLVPNAYDDSPLPIGCGQTISQPYIVAYMIQEALVGVEDRVLEIGTGCGYAACVLGEVAKEVFSIEIVESLKTEAERRIKKLGYKNIFLKTGDGTQGWPEKAPFDAIIVWAGAPLELPKTLISQLKEGGRLLIPSGGGLIGQDLLRVTKEEKGRLEIENLLPVRFVPLKGMEGWGED